MRLLLSNATFLLMMLLPTLNDAFTTPNTFRRVQTPPVCAISVYRKFGHKNRPSIYFLIRSFYYPFPL